jgi:hypothetical protein
LPAGENSVRLDLRNRLIGNGKSCGRKQTAPLACGRKQARKIATVWVRAKTAGGQSLRAKTGRIWQRATN